MEFSRDFYKFCITYMRIWTFEKLRCLNVECWMDSVYAFRFFVKRATAVHSISKSFKHYRRVLNGQCLGLLSCVLNSQRPTRKPSLVAKNINDNKVLFISATISQYSKRKKSIKIWFMNDLFNLWFQTELTTGHMYR